jgi:hypothetical protein
MLKLCEVAEVLELKQQGEGGRLDGEIPDLGFYSVHSEELVIKRDLARKQLMLQRQQPSNLPSSAPPIPSTPPPALPAEFSNYQPIIRYDDDDDDDEMTEEEELLRSKNCKPPSQQVILNQVIVNPLKKERKSSTTTVEKKSSAAGIINIFI